MSTQAVPATTEVKKSKKSKSKATVAPWPKPLVFGADGIAHRANSVRRFGTPDAPENYAPWDQVQFKDLASLKAFLGNDDKRLVKFATAGINTERRQVASLQESKVDTLINKFLELVPGMTREAAETLVRSNMAKVTAKK